MHMIIDIMKRSYRCAVVTAQLTLACVSYRVAKLGKAVVTASHLHVHHVLCSMAHLSARARGGRNSYISRMQA
jgi:hypothetical protein